MLSLSDNVHWLPDVNAYAWQQGKETLAHQLSSCSHSLLTGGSVMLAMGEAEHDIKVGLT